MNTPEKKNSKEIVSLEDKAAELDKAAEKFSAALAQETSPFTAALVLSRGITAIRALLTDDIMEQIMELIDTPLGFLTDQRTRKGGPYKAAEIKDAIIEAALRGYRVTGNEFNIISSRFYAAKTGLQRKVLSYPGLTDFNEKFSVPKVAGSSAGAVVTVSATWKKDGIADKLEPREIAIKGDQYASVDSYIGKAQRKLYAAVLNQIQGILTPEGEVDDAGATAKQATAAEVAPKGPYPSPGIWEGTLTLVERKPYKDGEKEGEYFVLTIDLGWKASTFSEDILSQAEVAIGQEVRMETKQGRSLSSFTVVSFEIIKPAGETAAPAGAQDDLPLK